MRVGLIADDFTGALDSASRLAATGVSVELELEPGVSDLLDGCVLCTNSRDLPEIEAIRFTTGAAHRLSGRILFKKIDSTLRGNSGAEIQSILDSANLSKALICPAAPEVGRTVYDGKLYVNGMTLEKTGFAHDPTWPATTADVKQLISRKTGLPITHLGLDVVRSGSAALRSAIDAASTQLISLDASEDSDLDAIAKVIKEAYHEGCKWLPCGSLGLAFAWASNLLCKSPTSVKPGFPHIQLEGPLLIVVGSSHRVTCEQITAFSQAYPVPTISVYPENLEGLPKTAAKLLKSEGVLILHPAENEIQPNSAWQRITTTLSKLTVKLCALSRPGVLLLTGGEMALSVANACNVQAVRVMGELQPGIPLSWLRGGALDGLNIITKAGGFGDRRSLISVYELMNRRKING
jgi:uncharacterized protein YgbK (DUF1537 family)